MAVGVGDGRFLDLEELHFHASLGGAVIRRALLADEVLVFPQPLEKPLLADIHAVLLQQLGEVSDEDGRFARTDRIREKCLRVHGLDLLLLHLDLLIPRRDLPLGDHQGVGQQLVVRHGFLSGDVAAIFSDAGKDFIKYPFFKSFRCREFTPSNKAVNVALWNKLCILFSARRKESAFYRPLAMLSKSIGWAHISKRFRHIRTAKQRLAVFFDDSHLPELGIFKNLQFVHSLAPFLPS